MRGGVITNFSIKFVKQRNGFINSDSYNQDGYIHLYYKDNNYGLGDTFLYSAYKINIHNFNKLTVVFKLVKDHPPEQNYRYSFRIGVDETQTQEGGVDYHTWSSSTFEVSENKQTYVLYFNQLSLPSNEYYLRIGGVQDVYI